MSTIVKFTKLGYLANSKLQIVKLIKENTGLGLKEAKDVVDSVDERYPFEFEANAVDIPGFIKDASHFEASVEFKDSEIVKKEKRIEEALSTIDILKDIAIEFKQMKEDNEELRHENVTLKNTVIRLSNDIIKMYTDQTDYIRSYENSIAVAKRLILELKEINHPDYSE